MDQNRNRPTARKKTYSSGGTGVHKRGDGLGTGKVGSGSYTPSSQSSSGGSGIKRAAVGGGGLSVLAVIVMLVMQFLGGGGSSNQNSGSGYVQPADGGYNASADGKVDTSVAKGSRAKRTEILGNGRDTVTIMVYMCGTDLESKYGMATNDINEMKAASFGKNVNVIVYTGGCTKWKTSSISSSNNQIYQIQNGQMKKLVDNDGAKVMTDPNTLSGFIKYCSKNYPANRNELILWDHGGGSVSGYGYDEKNKRSGSMDLAGISKALKDGGVQFDFVGFDACLMATAETALMLDDYADYLIASEETEPGIGWYYTNWLTKLGNNTSMPTVEIGKNIIDDFVVTCSQQCRGSNTTLSIIDLAEFANTVPENLNDFARSVSTLISNEDYKSVSDARYATREFAVSSKIDQVDLVNLAENIGTPEAKELSKAIQGAVKYNRTSRGMSDAYGVSIYFPYKRTSYVDTACSTYKQIGMDSEYSKCIRQFASLETSGQIAAGGSSSPTGSLFGGLSSGSSGNSDVIGSLINSFLSGGRSMTVDGLDSSNTEFMDERALSEEETAQYLADNYLDPSKLVWEEKDGKYTMTLTEEQWQQVHGLDLNMFYDDGEGYVDLGLDNVFSFEDNGMTLVADVGRDWVSINGQPVAYYHTDTVNNGSEYTIKGYVPILLNGESARLILVFDSENPEGYVVGAQPDYTDGETDTVAKDAVPLSDGDKIDFVCDYYTYDGEYSDSYLLGDTLTVNGELKITNTDVGDGNVRLMYRFTDIYDMQYWSQAIIK
ncbi:MAG: peptidase C11 [Ruminococcus sp.]|nr:peptidase C11 [Ruminococcus sp.]